MFQSHANSPPIAETATGLKLQSPFDFNFLTLPHGRQFEQASRIRWLGLTILNWTLLARQALLWEGPAIAGLGWYQG
jgi:hypothetical protein